MINNEETITKLWYEDYYKKRGFDRNDLFNREVRFQHLAYENCWLEAFSKFSRKEKVLDVGGGGGAGLLRNIQAGFMPENLYLIDILDERVAEATKRLPNKVNIVHGDASSMTMFEDKFFNVVTSSTMFIQLLDESLAVRIGMEMMRVLKDDGTLLIFDWRYDFWKNEYRAVDKTRIKKIFNNSIAIEERIGGQIIPPLGRFLSKTMPSIYFCVQKLPFLQGLVCYVLRKA